MEVAKKKLELLQLQVLLKFILLKFWYTEGGMF